MKQRSIFVWILLFCIILTSCQLKKTREPKMETSMVRLYDVIPVPEYADANGQYQYQYPVVRAGLEYGISMSTSDKASFLSAIDALQSRSGIEIEYVILDSWEKLRKELQESREDGVTKLVLFDNSYDSSLIKEVMSGGYIDFTPFMEEAGIYESEDYQQAVLQAGQIGTQQLLVPVLYNVAGVSFASMDYTAESLSYEQLFSKIQTAMENRTEISQLSVISKAMLDDIDPDLFLNAAGQPWDGYKRQQDFFNLLYEYVKNYNYEETMLKKTWSIYVDQLDDELQNTSMLEKDDVMNLSQDELLAVGLNPEEGDFIWNRLYYNTAYFVECTGAETEPYHSVVGMINSVANYYNGEYWPIQMYNEEGYAAQPFCYVAALDDGDEETAFKVIQEIMKQPFSLQFGFSVYEPAWREKLDEWINSANFMFDRTGRYVYYHETQKKWIEKAEPDTSSYSWNFSDEARRIKVGEVLTNQLDNIQYAQIADREIMSIWQETLQECVISNLSTEEGFELLCERMDAFWK